MLIFAINLNNNFNKLKSLEKKILNNPRRLAVTVHLFKTLIRKDLNHSLVCKKNS